MPRSKPSYTAVCRRCHSILTLVRDGKPAQWHLPDHLGVSSHQVRDVRCPGSGSVFVLPREVFG